jgi:hypothetical protein
LITNQDRQGFARLQRLVGDRLFVLGADSLEDSLPSTLYTRAGEDKAVVAAEIRRLRGNRFAVAAVKARVSNAVAAVLTLEDEQLLPELFAAVRRAVELAAAE